MGLAFRYCMFWILSILLMACGAGQDSPIDPPLVLIEDLEFTDPALKLCVMQHRLHVQPEVKWTHQMTQLECGSEYEVQSLADMAAFPNLERLVIRKLTAPKVDVALLKSLKDLRLEGSFEIVDASHHSLLEELSVTSFRLQVVAAAELPALKNLSVSSFNPEPATFSVKAVPRIEHLSLSNLQNPALDLHELSSLLTLQMDNIGIDNLDFSLLTKMEKLDLQNWISRELNLAENRSLKKFSCSYCTIGVITLAENNQLESIYVYGTDIKQLNVPSAKSLTELAVQANTELESIELPLELPKLKTVLLGSNRLREPPTALWPELERLSIENNRLTSLSLSSMPKLLELNAEENQIVAVDLSQAKYLQSLNLARNQIDSIDLSSAKELRNLNLSVNTLTDVKLDENVGLTWLTLMDNALVQVDLKKLVALEGLDVSGNKLTQLNVSALVSLRHLDAARNRLDTLEISSLEKLQSINLSENLLVSLTVNPDAPLSYLDVSNNFFERLDLSSYSWHSSIDLKAQNNQLREFIFPELNGGVVFFSQVDLAHNQLQSLEIGLGIFVGEAIFKANPLASLDVDPTIGWTYVLSMDISQTLLDCERVRQLPTVDKVQCGESAKPAAQ